MARLDGKVALITGGASGIGKATAQLFLEEGALVVISDFNPDTLQSALEELAPFGLVSGVTGDVRSMTDAAEMVSATVKRHGALDILVCNAGITSVAPIETLEEDEWNRVIETNVRGMYTLVKHAVPQMKAQGHGNIVTLGSEMGIVAVPESPAYNASKGAVIMFTKSIAIDLIRYNIRVNSLCPGITRTPLLQAEVDNSIDPAKTAAEQASWAPIMRVADPREIAHGALWLASDDSSFAVGSCLVLDGGFTAQ
ncbi:MAG: NAD(P)-dependent dehydrogenase, short-chain alcohol dehydrogenase family [Microbacteriaceae bacterium]|nr:NAD(P)-dependent dehydrogenase, short-chain alcohol dehydrogenase family [Microbacteriaceae bacterium]